jgi:sigma-B regulation protein RsbU (phosphoserine phosphatase)
MAATLVAHIHDRLLVQRQALANWLHNTPANKRQTRLGAASEQAVETRLEILDEAIEKCEGDELGVCEVCHGTIETMRLEMDFTARVCLEHLSEEEQRRLEDDLELSQQVQQALLPQQSPEIPGLDVAAFSRPARIVSGDYFDFFRFKDNTHGLTIGDVVDKGLAASLLMASMQASLKILVADNTSPQAVIERLNSIFIHSVRLSQFVTLFLGQFDPATRRLTYTNAGHNPPLVLRRSANGGNPIEWLHPTGAAIGLIEQSHFDVGTIDLRPGDVMVFYTDGVTDARNEAGQYFGTELLTEAVQAAADLAPRDLLYELRQRLQTFTNGRALEDDTTLVVCKVSDGIARSVPSLQ